MVTPVSVPCKGVLHRRTPGVRRDALKVSGGGEDADSGDRPFRNRR